MKILFISKYPTTHIGGVETHIRFLTKILKSKKQEVSIISEEQIKPPHIKYFGLIYIWLWFFKNRKLIEDSDVIHIHDVFIWYLPFRFLYPSKKVFITFHGWEGKYPIPFWNLINKQIANKLTNGSIAVGKYIEKKYKIKSDYIIYGGVERLSDSKKISTQDKIKNTILFVGRLEPDTGLLQFLDFLRSSSLVYGYENVSFVGDGSLRKDCEKFGEVYGFCDPNPFYKKAGTVVPSGYLTYLEAKSYGCKIKTFYGNELKKDYWDEIKQLKKFDTWEDIANKYIKLWSTN